MSAAQARLVEELASSFSRYGVAREDLIQEGWVALLETPGAADEQARFMLRMRMCRFVLDFYGPVRVSRGHVGELPSRFGPIVPVRRLRSTVEGPDERCIAMEERSARQHALLRALTTLSPEEREIIEALHLQAVPAGVELVARRLQLSVARVRGLEASAMAKLLPHGSEVLVGGRRIRSEPAFSQPTERFDDEAHSGAPVARRLRDHARVAPIRRRRGARSKAVSCR